MLVIILCSLKKEGFGIGMFEGLGPGGSRIRVRGGPCCWFLAKVNVIVHVIVFNSLLLSICAGVGKGGGGGGKKKSE